MNDVPRGVGINNRDLRTFPRATGLASVVVASAPWVAVLLVALAAAYVRLFLGHWPALFSDPVVLPHRQAVAVVAAIFAISPLLFLFVGFALMLWRRLGRVRPVLGLWSVVFAVGLIVQYALLRLDPYNFVAWVLD